MPADLFGPEANGPYEPLEDGVFRSRFTPAEITHAYLEDIGCIKVNLIYYSPWCE